MGRNNDLSVIHRILNGYGRIGTVVLRILVAVTTIVAAAAAISLPLWYLASEHKVVFNYTVLTATFVICASLVVRRVKRPSQRSHRTSRRGQAQLIVLALATSAALLGLTISPAIGGVLGIVALLGLGWTVGATDS